VNCIDSLFVWTISVYCSGFISERFPEAKNCEYFLLTGGDTCGLVFSIMVIAALFDCIHVVWHMVNMF
jgi:hypothetical protein